MEMQSSHQKASIESIGLSLIQHLDYRQGRLFQNNVEFQHILKTGEYDLVVWLISFYADCMTESDYDNAMKLALINNNIPVAEYILAKDACSGNWIDHKTVSKISRAGYLTVLQWMYNLHKSEPLKYPNMINCEIVHNAVIGGHIDILQWVATTEVHPMISKYGGEDQFVWSPALLSYAIQYNHIHILKWALDNGCPWNPYCHEHAARFGNIHILNLLVEKGYLIENNSHAINAALEHGRENVVKWIYGHPYSHDPDYIRNQTIAYVGTIKEELVSRAWHPSRLKWCLDFEEFNDIFDT